ncbi:MAG TPA: OmpH family outer membrane protein [Prolixibacteraceae bacterium]|nr:OmpH family outer membrane protein [Prolixibacteraceae bacterium]
MKKLPIILSTLALIGVIGLLVMFLISNPSKNKSNGESAIAGSGGLKIAYILTDSVLLNYQLAIDLHKDFLSQQQQYNSEFSRKRQNLESQATAFQEKLQRGGFLTEDRAVKERDKILGMEQEIQQLDYELSSKLSQLEASINQRLSDSILNYVKEYNKDHNYTFIFSNTGNIIVGAPQNNISRQILDGLNARYKSGK